MTGDWTDDANCKGVDPKVFFGGHGNAPVKSGANKVAGRCVNTPGRGRDLRGGHDVRENMCTADGCARPVKARGLCESHYARWHRHGDPWKTSPLIGRRKPVDPATRLWSKVDFTNPNGCWLWKGARRHRYGETLEGSHKEYAHRAIFQLVYGPLPPSVCVLHHCDTPLCVRPDHLFAGTTDDNAKDMGEKERWRNQYGAGKNWEPWQ